MKNLWEISTSDHAGDKESLMRRGNVYQIANGYMGYRGTLDEFGPEEAVGITLAGIFDRVGSAWREPVNAPNGGFTRVTLDGVELSALGRKVKRHKQTLRFTSALFIRETVFVSRSKTLTLRSSRFLSADVPNLGVIEFSFTCDKAANVTIHTGIDGNIWDLNGPHLACLTADARDGILLMQGLTHESEKRVQVAEAVDLRFGEESRTFTANRNLRIVRLRMEPRKSYTFHKYFAIFTDHDSVGKPLPQAAIETVRQAKALGYAACLAKHEAAWAKKWELCDVRIDGDHQAQHALRYSILQLLMVAPVNGSANSIPARALSGQVYKGAIFWDTEMFMLPFFLHTYPEKAVELMRYRIKTLDGARRKARSEGPGYRGAFYAWESQDTGDEACTYFNVGDPLTGRELRTYFRDKQVHISGDVAIAMWHYFKITGDDSLLLEGGAEVILECARFYYSYAYFKKEKERYEIIDVVGPDEYHERINNNAFTSRVAKETFAIASAAVDYLEKKHPEALRLVLDKIDIEAELPYFRDAAKHLFVPEPDPATGVIEQFDGYFRLNDMPVNEIKTLMLHPNEYLGTAQGLAAPTKIIKQADVVMMLNLFKNCYSSEIKKANWAYYEPRTEHGSSLSACAYAMLATEFGELDFAYKYFLKTAKIDLEAKYKVYVGTVFMGGSHPAANGGAWMTAIFGFGGVNADENQLVINPRLYRKWKSLEFNFAYRGDVFQVRITSASVTITAAPSNRREHAVLIAGTTVQCRPGEAVTVNVSIPPGRVVSNPRCERLRRSAV
ncbi:glycoside hydrolase family 65 protein [Termitidicoccus mucosus]|uniref:glycosyl hydrolase family 65 protein n=1 Tax=Termitidicoccus mucosus TaxID=1184151 RepID=UPI00083939FF